MGEQRTYHITSRLFLTSTARTRAWLHIGCRSFQVLALSFNFILSMNIIDTAAVMGISSDRIS